MKTLATMLTELMRADAVPMSDGCGHLYSDQISQCDCMTDRCQDFTPYLALLVEVRP